MSNYRKFSWKLYTQTDFEKTFLNQEQFFSNQKIVASRINETLNSLNRSLTYKINLASSVSYLSPVIDLNTCSVKMSTNRNESFRIWAFSKVSIYELLTLIKCLSIDLFYELSSFVF